MATKQLERVFRFNNKNLKDIDSNLSPEGILNVYVNQYPELLNSNIEGPEIKDNKAVYKFSKKIGTKG